MDKEKLYDENRMSTGIKLSNRRIFESASRDALRAWAQPSSLHFSTMINATSDMSEIAEQGVHRRALTLLTEAWPTNDTSK